MPESYSERGFAQYARDIPTGYGERVSVYESSAASGPYVWLNIAGRAHLDEAPTPHLDIPGGIARGSISAHCDLAAAKRVHAALGEWIAAVERDREVEAAHDALDSYGVWRLSKRDEGEPRTLAERIDALADAMRRPDVGE